MAITDWSESILIVDLGNEPAFSEDMDTLIARLENAEPPLPDVILNLNGVKAINSSNIAQMVRVRKKLGEDDARLRICSVPDAIWSVILVTNLDQVFEFTADIPTSIASLQME